MNVSQTIVDMAGHGTVSPPGIVMASDVMDMNKLRHYVNQGHVTQSDSHDGSLSLYKYSRNAQMNWMWDDVTMGARGLIVNNDTGELVARGFNKFFTFEQLIQLDYNTGLDDTALVMPKMDGSLGIAYVHNGQWNVATAGSLNSEQAQHATTIIREKYGDMSPIDGYTMCFEIIYPDNRIITNYGDCDDIVLLGGADQYGRWINPDVFDDCGFTGEVVSVTKDTVGNILHSPDPEDTSEGFVMRTNNGVLIKYKHPSYLTMHAARFHITYSGIVEWLRTGTTERHIEVIPDEFQDSVRKIAQSIEDDYRNILRTIDAYIDKVNAHAGDTRKEKALWINENIPRQYRGWVLNTLFSPQNREKMDKSIWTSVTPSGNLKL